jgi:tetratricopeptide (TPR) repeat protein
MIDSKLGRWDEALKKYERALSLSRASRDRIQILASMQTHFLWRGELERAFEQMRLKWAELEKSGTSVQFMLSKLLDARHVVKAGRDAEAFDIVESVREVMVSPYDGMVPLGYVFVYLELEEADSAEAALGRLMPFIEAYKIEQLRESVFYARGRIAEIRGNARDAILNYEQQLEMDPTEVGVHRLIGRCQRKIGEYEKAEASFKKTLKIFPNDAETLYEYALLLADRGDKDTAIDTLKTALEVWNNADPSYEPAAEARRLFGQWTT